MIRRKKIRRLEAENKELGSRVSHLQKRSEVFALRIVDLERELALRKRELAMLKKRGLEPGTPNKSWLLVPLSMS